MSNEITVTEAEPLSTQRVFKVIVPVEYTVFTDMNGRPVEVSRAGTTLWGEEAWNRRGRYLGRNQPAEVKRVCRAVASLGREG